jgi:hypothetical protein
MINIVSQIKEARRRRNLRADEISSTLKISENLYYDVESYPEEFWDVLSLREALLLLKTLEIDIEMLPMDSDFQGSSLKNLDEFFATLEAAKNCASCVFDDRVNYRLENGSYILESALDGWNLDCLFNVCKELKIDFKSVLIFFSKEI